MMHHYLSVLSHLLIRELHHSSFQMKVERLKLVSATDWSLEVARLVIIGLAATKSKESMGAMFGEICMRCGVCRG